ncbi:MAG TPA: aminotransferase class IV, partial [Vicinamibacterales bacterium]|jgi:branched-chain amino acid aminotransferase|nr:aminotransferase class IV [Vicinamibacterales bacterium]
MRNHRGELAECSQSNLFIVRGGAALTPPLAAGLLPGITREFVFELGAEEGIPVRESTLRLEDLLGADEAFITSTTRNITPVVRVGDQMIGAGKPGPVTARLIAAFRSKAQRATQDVGDSA